MSDTSNSKIIKYISHNILYLRKKHNITKTEMAKILGVGIKTLTKIEQGILPPGLSVDVLFKIQDYFGVPLDFQISEKLCETTEKMFSASTFARPQNDVSFESDKAEG